MNRSSQTPRKYRIDRRNEAFGALGEQASCLLLPLKQAGCLLSQCLERLKTIGLNKISSQGLAQAISVAKTEAGPDVTIRRVVAPKPGLAGHESSGFEKSVDAEGCQSG